MKKLVSFKAGSMIRMSMAAWLVINFHQLRSCTSAGKNIVLVHGAFADGSGWEAVLQKFLKSKGFNVSVVGNPNTGLADDAAATKRVIARQTGPVLLVGPFLWGRHYNRGGQRSQSCGPGIHSGVVPDANESLLKIIAIRATCAQFWYTSSR